MNMETTNIVDENIKRIGELFPNCMTEKLNAEGKPEMAIDFDQLRQELSKNIVEGQDERYQFTWPDKRNAIRLANAPTTDTLRPCRKESVDFDNTQNLYIEGNNLEVLKILRENYLGKVKMIYIDPPYNTGNDFIYNDKFDQDKQDYIHNSGQYDEDGNQLVTNTESNGRFHTDWLNMIYPRLKVAKDLLREDGVIFISIDDNEFENLKKICNEIFGSHEFIGTILWKKKTNGNNMGFLPPVHDYILCFSKNIYSIQDLGYPITQEYITNTYSNPDNDSRGPWTTTDLSANHKGPYFPIKNPNTGEIHYPADGRYWVFNEEEVKRRIADGRIIFGKSGNGKPVQKVFAKDKKSGKIRADSWWDNKAMNSDATEELQMLFSKAKLFTHPKPSKLIYHLLKISTEGESLILDFFSGSASTAHAVMQLNAEDGGTRKFIMVQLPEVIDEKNEAYKAGFKNICEIGKERIRRAGKKIKEEHPEAIDLDTGFRVLKLDSSNMYDVYYTPAEFKVDTLFEDNIKHDRTEEDLMFQAMIELGIDLSAKIEKNEIAGKTVWNVSDGFLLACFDKDVNETTITEVAKQKPYYFIMRDSSIANDNVADNFEQIFEHYSKNTIRRIM